MPNKYLESIESMEQLGTGLYEQSTPNSTAVLEVNSDTPSMTYAESPAYEEMIQDSVSYLAPQKIIVRRYTLRK